MASKIILRLGNNNSFCGPQKEKQTIIKSTSLTFKNVLVSGTTLLELCIFGCIYHYATLNLSTTSKNFLLNYRIFRKKYYGI